VVVEGRSGRITRGAAAGGGGGRRRRARGVCFEHQQSTRERECQWPESTRSKNLD
jgi:hypothetical protein